MAASGPIEGEWILRFSTFSTDALDQIENQLNPIRDGIDEERCRVIGFAIAVNEE